VRLLRMAQAVVDDNAGGHGVADVAGAGRGVKHGEPGIPVAPQAPMRHQKCADVA
jgi:hypothetical protein